MDGGLRQYASGHVATDGARIESIGPMSDCPAAAGFKEVLDCAGCAVLPGLINAHTHLPMSYFRGLADDLPLMTWLTDHIWPAEGEHLSPEFCYHASRLACLESIKSGVSCVNDMYLFEKSVASAVADCGMRGYVAEGAILYPTPAAASWQDSLRLTKELIAEYSGHPLIEPSVACHAPYSCTPEILTTLHALSREDNRLFHIHLHETEAEPGQIGWLEAGESPVAGLARLGILGPRTIGAHCVWVGKPDMALMHEQGCGCAHCPASNLKLASGVAPTVAMLEAGVNVGLGTDGAASNNNLDMWEELHMASLLPKGILRDATAMPAHTAVQLATSGGAAALGDKRIGMLEPGRLADICVINLDTPHTTPRYAHEQAIYSYLAYASQAADVLHTIVGGRLLMRDREVLSLNESAVLREARDWLSGGA
jgi:5-methylthioadenosine/S-adenosylhomocysteine deaminase